MVGMSRVSVTLTRSTMAYCSITDDVHVHVRCNH